MALDLSIGGRDGLANAQGFNELFTGGTLKIYSGASPGVEYGATGTELISFAVSFTSAGTGKVSIQQTALIAATGTAGYFRLSASADTPTANADGTAIRADGLCGVLELSCDLTLVSLNTTAGVLMTIQGDFNIPA